MMRRSETAMSDVDQPSDQSLTAAFEAPSREAWLKLVDKVLKGGGFEKRLVSRTADGLAIAPLASRADAGSAATAIARKPSYFLGGWDVRQRHAEPDPVLANAAILEDLQGGVTSLLLQIEAPGQSGINYGAEALATALKGVFLNGCTVALDARENTMDAAGSLIELWRQANLSENARLGAFNFDPLGGLAATGTLYYPADRSCEIAAKLAVDCRGMSNVTALLADGRPYHEAGASEAQELAAMLATLLAYVRACEAQGLRPRMAFGKIGLSLAADSELFLTIAKLRAARVLIARVAEACGAASVGAVMHLSVTTSARMLARRDPWVNMLRATAACAGAALGGADAITVLPFTWALGKPDAFARRMARNTQLVLQEESGLGRVMDPAAGASSIEQLTTALAGKAWELFQDVERQGGMAKVLESGIWQGQIASIAEARSRAIATGRLELTGVSAFARLGDGGVKVVPHPPAGAVVEGGTSVVALPAVRLAAPFEDLRDAADAFAARTGAPPRVFLANLGELAAHSARSTWMRNFLATGGIEAVSSEALLTSLDAGKALADSGARIACICASDAVYGELAEATAGALVAAGAASVLLVGRPREQEAALRSAGVDTFVFAGCDAVAVLTRLHEALGV